MEIKVCNKCKNNTNFINENFSKWEPVQGYFIAFSPKNDVCPYCGSRIELSGINYDEYKIISAISNDNKFLEAMIDLKEKDIIEYELKMSQFRTQAEQQNQIQAPTTNNTLRCPTCGSTNVQRISATAKMGGAMLFGLFSKTARSQFKCNNCGYKW